MIDYPCVLIGCMRVRAFARNIVNRLSMLTLVSRYHIHWLLQQVEIEVLVAHRWSEVEIPIDERLGTCVEKGIYV